MIKIAAPDFDLEKTLNCGQVFHWEKSGAGFVGAVGNKAAYVEQRGDQLRFTGLTAKAIANYFSLDHPLANICRSFPRDPAMTAARDFCRGLRIIRQPRWECLATFICSSMKQVAHIRQISLALRKRFGTKRMISLNHVYDFPRKRNVTAYQLREFCDRYFGENGGYAQQYLFHHARVNRRGR